MVTRHFHKIIITKAEIMDHVAFAVVNSIMNLAAHTFQQRALLHLTTSGLPPDIECDTMYIMYQILYG